MSTTNTSPILIDPEETAAVAIPGIADHAAEAVYVAPNWKLVMKYPVRLAFNPLVSTIGWYLPLLFPVVLL